MSKAYLGLGTNLGNRKGNLGEAVSKINELIGKVLKTSSVYETPPWGFESDAYFLNQVIELETKHSPREVLNLILSIESVLGRVRNEERYSSRIIDIDILLYEDKIIDDHDLKIPHPLMHERRFVLVPLCELSPELFHPVLGKSMCVLLRECTDSGEILKL